MSSGNWIVTFMTCPLHSTADVGPARSGQRLVNCPHDCPCGAPKPRIQSRLLPTRSIGEAKEKEGFTRKIEDVREARFRLANRRLQPLGHLTADLQVYETKILTRKRARAKW
jgi:hypothetical protein